MRSFINLSLLTISLLSLVTISCAPKDKRFEAIKHIDKLKTPRIKPKGKAVDRTTLAEPEGNSENTPEAAFPRATLVTDNGLEILAPQALNPSNIKETELIVKLEKLEVGDLSDYDEELDLEIIVRLIDSSSIVEGAEPIQSNLSIVKLDKFPETTKSIDLSTLSLSQITITRDNLNMAIKNILSISPKAKLAIELIVEQSMNIEGRNKKVETIKKSKVASVLIDLVEIKNEPKTINAKSNFNHKEPDGDDIKGLYLLANIMTDGDYKITDGILANDKRLICELAGETTSIAEVSNQSIKILENIHSLIDFDFNQATVTHKIIGKTVTPNSKIENILTQNHFNKQEKSTLVIAELGEEEKCNLKDTLLKDFTHITSLGIHTVDGNIVLQGCCRDAELELEVNDNADNTEGTPDQKGQQVDSNE